MMPFTGGIDRQLEMEMLKGPQQLQREMQTLGPDTIRMIALKRFADQEKANAMQANLQAQPPMATVADQLEQTVRGIASMRRGTSPAVQEVARRVGGVNQQKAIQAQKNMQRVAQGPTRPVMAAEGGLMSRPVNNIGDRYFQGGGIVGFSAGSGVMGTGNRYQKDSLEEVIGAGVDAVADFLPNRRRKAYTEILRKLRKGEPITSGERRALRSYEQEFPEIKAEDAAIRKSDALAKEEGYDVEGLNLTGIELPEQRKPFEIGQSPTPASAPTATTTGPAASTATTTGAAAGPAATPAAGIASVSPTLAPTPAKSGLAALTETLKERTEKSPEEAARLRREEAQKALGYTEEEQAQLDAMKEEAKGLETRLLDPKMNRFRAIREAIAAGANTGSLGGTGAAISSAVSAGQDRVANLERELTKERREQEREDIEKSREIRALAYGEGREEAQLTRAEADSALQGLFNAARDENKIAAQTALTNASNQTKVAIANMEADISREANRLRKEANDLAREDRKLVGLSNQVTKLVSDEARIRADIVARYALQMDAARNALIAPRSDEEAEKAQAAYDRLNKEMTSEIQKATENVRAQMDDIRDAMSSIVTSVTKI